MTRSQCRSRRILPQHMTRRYIIHLVGGVVMWPLAASAQQRAKLPRVGVLVAESAPHPFTEAFRSGMRDLGYAEGRSVTIEWRYADALFSRAIELATELVRIPVDVIAAHHTPAVKASMSVTSTIPIVMSPAGAPLQAGLVKSLAYPGGNVTGLSSMEAELGGKRLELLLSLIPGLARVAVLGAKTDPFTTPYVQDFQNAAARAGLQLKPVLVDGPRDFVGAFAEMSARGAQAVVIQPLFQPHTKDIVQLATKHRLAVMSSYRDTTQAGGLISYSGLVANLAHPGGNVTGLSASAGPELIGKNLELLRHAVPGVTRVAALWHRDYPERTQKAILGEAEAAARPLGVRLQFVEAGDPDSFDRAFLEMVRMRAEALTVLTSVLIVSSRRRLVDLAARHRLPAVYPMRLFVDEGGLMSYGPLWADIYRRAATHVDKILKGAKPGDLPVEQPTKFELVINLKTAKTLESLKAQSCSE